MLIFSWPCALPESKFWIILAISSWEVIEDKRLLVKYCIFVGRVLPLFFRKHCFEKNELKCSAFSKKLVTNLFSWNNGGIKGIFLLFKGTLMQIWKSPYMFVLMQKQNSENFPFWTLGIVELYTRKVCKMFVYKHSETIEYVKN